MRIFFFSAYLFREYEDITEESTKLAEEHSPIAVDTVSGVCIGVFDEEQREADHDKQKEFEEDKQNNESDESRKTSISSFTDKLLSMTNMIQMRRGNKEWFNSHF